MDKKQSQTKASSSNGFASKFVNLAKRAITAKSEWTDKVIITLINNYACNL